jgi:hypothetical protein
MAAKDEPNKAGEAARTAQQSQYIQRLVEDENLRSNLLSAYAAARTAYGRLSNGTPAAEALFEDPELREQLSNAINSLRESTSAADQPTKPVRRRRGVGRSLVLLVVGSALALALSESLRSKVLDLLFGAEEEFDYSPTTAPETPAPAGVAGS